MENVIVLLIVVAVVGLAVGYMRRARKNGVKCIGCPSGCSCSGGCSGGCSGNCGGETASK